MKQQLRCGDSGCRNHMWEDRGRDRSGDGVQMAEGERREEAECKVRQDYREGEKKMRKQKKSKDRQIQGKDSQSAD